VSIGFQVLDIEILVTLLFQSFKLSQRLLLRPCIRAVGKWRRVGKSGYLPTLPRHCLEVQQRTFFKMATLPMWWSESLSPDSPGDIPVTESTPISELEVGDSGEEKLLTRRVHILGLGSIGTLVAHSLKCLPNPPPVTLMIHKQDHYADFKRIGRTISLINKKNEINDEQTGYDVDLYNYHAEGGPGWAYIPDQGLQQPPTHPLEDAERLERGEVYIYTLIVAVKGPSTVDALRSVKHRVNAQTTICFMQNGLGQIDELNQEVFTDPSTRPTYMLGIVSHGAFMADSCRVHHTGYGSIALGIWRDPDRYPFSTPGPVRQPWEMSEDERKRHHPTDKELFSSLSSRYLLRTLTRSPILACALFPYLDLLQLQLEKLSTNCIMNPLTALLDIQNGQLLDTEQLLPIQKLLLAEISLVIRGLPELEGLPGVKHRFSAKRLEQLMIGVTKKTALNSSSMREDFRKARQPEIDYINGYIVKRGEEQGVKCVLNYMLMQLIKSKHALDRAERLRYDADQIRSKLFDPQQSASVVVSHPESQG
jgi:2-dehydropantoate 2-reductase